MPTKDWMRHLPDNATLNEITMPGSHDAGVFLSSNPGYTKAQDRDLMAQCYAGSRFFDLRAYKAGGGAYKFGHFADAGKLRGRKVGINKHSMGGSLTTELANIGFFLDANPTETVILRFAHIRKGDAILSAVLNTLGTKLARTPAHGPNGSCVAMWPLGDLRGKVLACFDVKDFKGKTSSQMGLIPFMKFGHKAGHQGLVTCGEYADSKSMSDVIESQRQHYQQHQIHSNVDHLLVVYWQQTGGNIEKNTRAGAHAQLMSLANLAGGGHQANVILHDFVSPTTCAAIVEAFNGITV